MKILLKNATVVTQDKERSVVQNDILVENDIICKIADNISPEGHQVIDLKNKVIIPGLIQTHTHLCQTLFRNLADDLELMDWLSHRIWPMEMAHDDPSIRASARLGLAELMLGGTTTIMDMGCGNKQQALFEEIAKSGIRAFAGKVMMDNGSQEYKEDTSSLLAETRELIEEWHQSEENRIHYALAPRFVPSCSSDLWHAVKQLSEEYDLIIHTHASENKKEIELVQNETGFSNIVFFLENGMASSNLCLAHCIWISDQEMEIISKYGINVLHCPSANLKLGSGFAPVPEMVKAGINVSLGADGVACNNNFNMFNEMRLAALIQKPIRGVLSTNAQQIFDFATINGAKALRMEDKIGSIEVGKKADLVVMNLNKVHCVPADNIFSQLVYSAHSTDVEAVMIDGRWRVLNNKLIDDNTEDIVETAWREARRLVERIN